MLWLIQQCRLNRDLQDGIFNTSCSKKTTIPSEEQPGDALAAGCPCQTCWLETLGPNRAVSPTSRT